MPFGSVNGFIAGSANGRTAAAAGCFARNSSFGNSRCCGCAVWVVGAIGKTKTTPAPAPADNITWVRPQPGERSLGIVASNPIDLVTLTDSSGTVLYRGALKAGENRSVQRLSEIIISTDQPQNLSVQVEAGGTLYPLKDGKTGQFLKRSTVKAP